MPTWTCVVVFCAVLLLVAHLVQRRDRARRAGLVAPADTTGRSGADTTARARLGPHGAGDGSTAGSHGGDGGN
ncbi:hypothetical protein [Saccharothrix sp. Mg75]|uniref:hypothetical protein n=1 Tax=Saccharothrix sp. Mg75 TaxID=3445357 RepID=UPI003EEE620F